MSYTINKNYTDTSTGKAAPEISVSGLNFGADFRITNDTKGSTDIVNITSPIGFEESMRFSASNIANIYSNTALSRDLRYPSTRGTSVLCQLNDIWTAVNNNDPSDVVALPMSCHLVIKVPANGLITSSDVLALIGRMLGGLFETGSTDTSRLDALLRQATKPKEL